MWLRDPECRKGQSQEQPSRWVAHILTGPPGSLFFRVKGAARPEFRWYALSRVTPRDDAQPCSTSSGTGGASRRATAVDNLGAPGSAEPVETRRRSAGARRPPGSGCMPPRLRYGPAPGRAGPTLVGSGFLTCGSSVHNSMVHSEWTVCVPVGATQSGSTCGMCIRPSRLGVAVGA